MFDYTFHWHQALRAWPRMLEGALVTLEIAVLSMVIGISIAIVLAVARTSKIAVFRAAAISWIELARNTPALFQIYMVHFGLGAFGLHLSPYLSLLVGIAFNNAGYLAETFRGALRAIPPTQTRAARSLGMGPVQAFVLIIVPQMFRIAFLPASNQMVWAILMTDLAGVTQDLNVRTFRTFDFFALAAVFYYCIAKSVAIGARLIAWRLFRY